MQSCEPAGRLQLGKADRALAGLELSPTTDAGGSRAKASVGTGPCAARTSLQRAPEGWQVNEARSERPNL